MQKYLEHSNGLDTYIQSLIPCMPVPGNSADEGRAGGEGVQGRGRRRGRGNSQVAGLPGFYTENLRWETALQVSST